MVQIDLVHLDGLPAHQNSLQQDFAQKRRQHKNCGRFLPKDGNKAVPYAACCPQGLIHTTRLYC